MDTEEVTDAQNPAEEILEGVGTGGDQLVSPNPSGSGLDFVSWQETIDESLNMAYGQSIAIGVIILIAGGVISLVSRRYEFVLIGLMAGFMAACLAALLLPTHNLSDYRESLANSISEGYGVPIENAEAMVFQSYGLLHLESPNNATSIYEIGIQQDGKISNIQVQFGLDSQGDLRVYVGELNSELVELPLQ